MNNKGLNMFKFLILTFALITSAFSSQVVVTRKADGVIVYGNTGADSHDNKFQDEISERGFSGAEYKTVVTPLNMLEPFRKNKKRQQRLLEMKAFVEKDPSDITLLEMKRMLRKLSIENIRSRLKADEM